MQVLQVMIQEAPALEALAGEAEAEAEAEARGEAEAEAGGERKGKQYAMTAHIPSRRPLPVPGTEVEDGEDEERLRAMMEEDFENF
jgi:septal ring factor EnvC (AmiA/AmiB activator)